MRKFWEIMCLAPLCGMILMFSIAIILNRDLAWVIKADVGLLLISGTSQIIVAIMRRSR